MVLDHFALATSIAHRYDHRGLERQDLEQVALLGLVQAVRRYDPEQGSGFLAFAVPTITGELKRHFRDHGWAVRPPRQLQEHCLAVRSSAERLAQELGRDPTAAEVAASLGLSVRDVGQARGVDGQYVARSMDAPLDHDGGTTLSDTLGETATDLDRVDDFETLRPLLRNLKSRERLIVRLRFVDNLTQRQIGQRIGVSQMQVSRLLSDILLRLRRAIAAKHDDISAAS
ncbi:alternative sigma factor SigF [Flexivirga endophytica]|uniref:Alternative sigma factor SigF n=1 Tax=Flexivirga endophytica TaxID=1849103 RepID=A0A916WW54_9MICO|nr:alternative sigma factor SigF [Flexivirga endophytica]